MLEEFRAGRMTTAELRRTLGFEALNVFGERRAVVSARCAEQPALAILVDLGCSDVGMECFRECMVTRHCVMLAAFLVKSDLPTRSQPMSQPDAWRMIRRRAVAAGIHAPIGNHSFRVEIFHLHRQSRGDAGEGIGEGGDQRAIAQIGARYRSGWYRSVCATLCCLTGVVPVFTTCFGPRTAEDGLVGTPSR